MTIQRSRYVALASHTVRRFGWSNESMQDAQREAEVRAQDALQRVLAGEKLPRRDFKTAYNGGPELPIREEVLQRLGEHVVTRNTYGAQCLNTPNVLFADVDFPVHEPGWFKGTFIAGVGIAALVYQFAKQLELCCSQRVTTLGLLLTTFLVAVVLWHFGFKLLSQARFKAKHAHGGGPEARALENIRHFVARHPGWRARVYRTPHGYRVLATHATFDPTQAEVGEFFKAIEVDTTYAIMCQNQRCFRARLTAKPWRIGISAHLRPRPGVWPVNPDKMPLRTAWVRRYEVAAAGFAACRYLETMGGDEVHEAVRPVVELHDRLSQALSGKPIA